MTISAEPRWVLPEPRSTHELVMDDGTSVILRRHGNPDKPRLVISHGNGLAVDLYYPFWSLLLNDYDLIVYDLRNHGWNPSSSLQNHIVPSLIDDHDRIMEGIDERYGNKPKIGVFHSLSALATLLSPTLGSDFVARVLFDPPFWKPGRSDADYEGEALRLATMTRRRTVRFKRREDFAVLLSIIPTFKSVQPGVYDLFARTTLRECNDSQGYELCCPREFEAQMIQYARSFAVLVDFDETECPTKVIGADPTLPYSYLPTLDPGDVFTVDYDFLPDASHFLQLEQPKQCAALMNDFIRSLGIA